MGFITDIFSDSIEAEEVVYDLVPDAENHTHSVNKHMKNIVDCVSCPVQLPEEDARKVDELFKVLPADCHYQRKGMTVDFQFEPGERSEVSIITTERVDKDNEVVIASGVDLDTYRNSMVVLYEHNKENPCGTCTWIKLFKDTLRAKTTYPPKPEDVDVSWLPDNIWALTKCMPPILRCKSIGFVPRKPKRRPTLKELEFHPEWKDAGILDDVMLLEYSVISNGCNYDAVVEQINKSIDPEIFKALGIEVKAEDGLFHPNCLLGDTPIFVPGTVAGLEASYNGTCRRIVFANGDTLSCTPNHLFLTPTGFARAEHLVAGENVVYCPLSERLLADIPNDYRKPATIEKVVGSLSETSGVPTIGVPITSEDLHGDGRFCNGNVNIVHTTSPLPNKRDIKPFHNEQFSGSRLWGTSLPSQGMATLILKRLAATPDGFVGFSRDTLALLRSKTLKPNEVGFTTTTNGQTKFLQPIEDYSSAYAQHFADCQDAFPGVIQLNQIVEINDFAFHGKVYDLQNESTLNIVNTGIITSNCRCTIDDNGNVQTAGDDRVCDECQNKSAAHNAARTPTEVKEAPKKVMSLADAIDYVSRLKKSVKPNIDNVLSKAIDALNFDVDKIIRMAKEEYKNRGRV